MSATPGPWRTGEGIGHFGRNRVWAGILPDSIPVAMLVSQGSQPPDLDPTAQANAKLIAAAPDLFSALTDMLPYAEKQVRALQKQMVGNLYPNILESSLAHAHAALAKARGES